MVKNIVFDFGGVIVLLDPEQAMQRFESIGVTNAREQMNIFGQTGIFREVEDGTIDWKEFCHKLAVEVGREEDFTFEEAQWAWLGYIKDKQHEGGRATLAQTMLQLKEKYNVCLLSNTNPFIQKWAQGEDFAKEVCPEYKGKLTMRDFFHTMYCSFEMGDYKPSESIFHKMLTDGNMKAEETLFLDDSPRNIEAAERVGIKGMLIGREEDWQPRLKAYLEGE